MINQMQKKIRLKKINKKILELRSTLWPDLKPDQLWDRKKESGFITIPRTLTLLMNMMDQISKAKPLSRTYLTLWCRTFDEMVINIKNESEFAFESGFSGQRAVITWRERMKRLNDYVFIKAKEGAYGKYSYVLLMDPHKIIEKIKKQNKGISELTFNSYIERCLNIGRTKETTVD
jgi:hypothetical protein